MTRSLLISLQHNQGRNSRQKKFSRESIPEMLYRDMCEKFCQKTENLDFGREGIFLAIYVLGKHCRS